MSRNIYINTAYGYSINERFWKRVERLDQAYPYSTMHQPGGISLAIQDGPEAHVLLDHQLEYDHGRVRLSVRDNRFLIWRTRWQIRFTSHSMIGSRTSTIAELIQHGYPVVPGLNIHMDRSGLLVGPDSDRVIALMDWTVPSCWFELNWIRLESVLNEINSIPSEQL